MLAIFFCLFVSVTFGLSPDSDVVSSLSHVGTADQRQSLADRLWVELDLQKSYDTIAQLRFCFDFDSKEEVLQLLRETLPADELAVTYSPGTDVDSERVTEDVCSSWDTMAPYVCRTEEEFTLYFQFVLRFDDPEKIPDTSKCVSNTSVANRGCQPGFFETLDGKAHPCCEGFFCPQMMNCMIPCPLGANCPRARSVVVPREMLRGLDTTVEERICSPYGYRRRSDLGCGGADKWDASPAQPIFTVGDNRDHIYCPSGHYCENTIDYPVLCNESYSCRVGSIQPSRCPFMTVCEAGTSLPEDYFGFVFDGFMFVLLALTWQVSKYYNRILRRLTARERIRIRWGVHPEWDVVPRSTHGSSSDLTESVFVGGPSGRMRASFQPRLVALQTISSTLSRPFKRNPTTPDSSTASRPAVWASLSQELRPLDEEGDDKSQKSEEYLMENIEFNAITIDFYALSLKVRSCGKPVVSGASGRFCSSKLSVVMGPSGCGKTSLLSFLACQGDYCMTNGVTLVNGVQTTLKKYRKVTGFVPQDDIIFPKLTVEESLLFSARYRLPMHTQRHGYLDIVDRAIQLLGLVDVRNQLVGNEESRGISGGQRKRVNIGLELVADPWILFLDEPTSGLDATSCRHVLSALSKIAHMGVTCAAVVHQPSNRVMKMFDDVLLMGQNGQTIYYGPQAMLKTYFMQLGFTFPIDDNPADVYLDIITRPKTAPTAPNKTLMEIWETSEFHDRYLTQPHLDNSNALDVNGRTPRHSEAAMEGFGFVDRVKNTMWMCLYLIVSPFCIAIDNIYRTLILFRRPGRRLGDYTTLGDIPDDEELRVTPGFFTQFWLIFYRNTLERTRSALRIFLEYALYAVSGMILGLLSDARSSGRLKFFLTDMNYNIVAIALMTTVSSLRTFSQNQLIFFRESRAGLNKLAYYCAMSLFGDVGSILKGLCYLSLYYSYAQPRAHFGDLFLVTTMTIYSCSGFGYLISKVMRPGPAQLASAVFVLSNALLAKTGKSSILIEVIKNVLYHRWALEAYIISEAKQLFGVWSLERCGMLQQLGYDIRHFTSTIIALIVLGVATRVLSFVIIMFGMRDRSE